jgi:deoxyadenosine/deoxycytidine kinase
MTRPAFADAPAARPKIIAVAGNIGAGKSSLVDWLSRQFGMVPFFEPHDENPYLASFYEDMHRWAFQSQLFFLVRRFQIHRKIAQHPSADRPLVQDRTLYEDAEIFAKHLHRQGYIDDRDYRTYQDLYLTLRDELRPPDLMIYLRCPLRTLVKRIARRGREFEQAIPRAYLRKLEVLYEEWFERYDLSPSLVIETDRVAYIEHLFDRLELVEAVRRHVGEPVAPRPKEGEKVGAR